MFDPSTTSHSMFEDRERLGRDAAGFLFALTYPRRKTQAAGTASATVGHFGGKEMHEKFMAEMKVDDERRAKKNKQGGSQRSSMRPSRASMLSLTASTSTYPTAVEDTMSQSSAEKSSDSGAPLSRSHRTQQSFLKKFGSMSKKSVVQKKKRTTLL